MIPELALAAALLPAVTQEADWKIADPDYQWQFPQDHWAHSGYRTEWWYFTGHLESSEGRRFGYQFTFFKIGLLPNRPDGASQWNAANLVMGHASITDPESGQHRFSEVVHREVPFLAGFGTFPDTLLAWSQAPAGTDGRWELSFEESGFALDMRDDRRGFSLSLQTEPDKPRIFQGPNGFSRKGAGESAASQYYSYSRLKTAGTVTLDGVSYSVQGTSWMDKEFGSDQLDDEQVGWDWFSLQLDDRREVMLFSLRDEEGEIHSRAGTLVAADGSVQWFDPGNQWLRALSSWESEKSGVEYPSGWRIRLEEPGLSLELRPVMANQENRSSILPDMAYWEGAVDVFDDAGNTIGRGYVELTGYGDAMRPGI